MPGTGRSVASEVDHCLDLMVQAWLDLCDLRYDMEVRPFSMVDPITTGELKVIEVRILLLVQCSFPL